MAFFDIVKDRAAALWEALMAKLTDLTERAHIAVMRREFRRQLGALYSELGRLYADGADAGALGALTHEVAAVREKLAALEKQKASIGKDAVCPVCGAQVKRGLRFCPNCRSAMLEAGTKMNAPAEEIPKRKAEEPPERKASEAEKPAEEAFIFKPLTFDKQERS